VAFGHRVAVATAIKRPPYEAYAGIMGTFVAGLAAAGAVARRFDREPQCQSTLDLVVLAAATFKASRTITRDQVTSFLREPFVEGDASRGEDEEPAGEGLQRAIGELITCSRCTGTWVATALTSTQILAPRFGRLLTWSLAAAALNDWLQVGFTALTEKTNELEERAG
jgi:hypothetical protein